MRILNVIMCLDPVEGGGSVERIYQLSRHLSLAGQDCVILTTRQGWDQEYIRKLGNVKVVALPYLSKRFRIPLGLFGWLRRSIFDYDVVHLAMNWTLINVITYLYLRFYRRPYIYSAMGWLKIDGRLKLLKHIYKAIFTRSMVKNSKMCIAVTRREVKDYEEMGVPKDKICLVPNGLIMDSLLINSEEKIFRSNYHLDSRPVILFIGRLNRIKGPDLLIEAFAGISNNFPDYQLVIAGNNYGFLEELRQLVNRLNIKDKVTFLGPIFGTEKFSAYCSADLFVIPSRFDTMTIVALEAAASGTPVLLTKQCDFDELQEQGGGLAVDATVEGLKGGLSELLSNRERLKVMGRRARDYVLKTYNWSDLCKRWVEIFEKAKNENINS